METASVGGRKGLVNTDDDVDDCCCAGGGIGDGVVSGLPKRASHNQLVKPWLRPPLSLLCCVESSSFVVVCCEEGTIENNKRKL